MQQSAHYQMSVYVNGRCRLNKRLMPMDDVVCLAAYLKRYTSLCDSSLQIHVELDYVYTYFDLFKQYELMNQLYDVLVSVIQYYQYFDDEIKKEFPLEELNKLRERVFSVSLLNKI